MLSDRTGSIMRNLQPLWIAALVAVLAIAGAPPAAGHTAWYWNDRFGFGFGHPKGWRARHADNADGVRLTHPKDARITITAWGQHNVLRATLETVAAEARTLSVSAPKQRRIRLAGLSGVRGDWPDRIEVVLIRPTRGSSIVYTLRLEVPPEKMTRFRPVFERAIASFRIGKGADLP